jgi:hypothetical protein
MIIYIYVLESHRCKFLGIYQLIKILINNEESNIPGNKNRPDF